MEPITPPESSASPTAVAPDHLDGRAGPSRMPSLPDGDRSDYEETHDPRPGPSAAPARMMSAASHLFDQVDRASTADDGNQPSQHRFSNAHNAALLRGEPQHNCNQSSRSSLARTRSSPTARKDADALEDYWQQEWKCSKAKEKGKGRQQ